MKRSSDLDCFVLVPRTTKIYWLTLVVAPQALLHKNMRYFRYPFRLISRDCNISLEHDERTQLPLMPELKLGSVWCTVQYVC